MSKQRNAKTAFAIGSFVGFAQLAVATAVSMRGGPVAGIIASFLTYILCYNAYLWATDPGESDEQPKE